MKHTGEYIVALVSLFTLGLFGVASYYPLENLWGFNHLHFLPQWWFWVYCALILLAVYLFFGFKSEQRVVRVVEAIDNLLFTGRARPRLILALVCGLLFYLFRVQTHLLGDGYTWLAEFGRGEAYIHKLTEPGASPNRRRWRRFKYRRSCRAWLSFSCCRKYCVGSVTRL